MKPRSKKAIFKMAPHVTGARSLLLTMGTFIRSLALPRTTIQCTRECTRGSSHNAFYDLLLEVKHVPSLLLSQLQIPTLKGRGLSLKLLNGGVSKNVRT